MGELYVFVFLFWRYVLMAMRIGILGYGNLGKGVEKAVSANADQELVAVFTRRDPALLKIASASAKVYSVDDLPSMKDEIDVLVLCGGSATDLPVQTPQYASMFNVVDSFDTHANIPSHFAAVDAAASGAGKIGVISCGWDPGMFSIARLYAHSVLPDGKDYTFWGRGVSQGHSDAIRRIEGVKDARQYTVPVPASLEAVRSGQNPELTTRTHVSATWSSRMVLTRLASKKRSRRCRTTSPIMIPPSPSSPRMR